MSSIEQLSIESKISLDYWFDKLTRSDLLPVAEQFNEPFYSIKQKIPAGHYSYLKNVSNGNQQAEFIIYLAHYHLLLSNYLHNEISIFTPPLKSESSISSPLFLKCDKFFNNIESLSDNIKAFRTEFQESFLHKEYDLKKLTEKIKRFEQSIDSLMRIGFGHKSINDDFELSESTVCYIEFEQEDDGLQITLHTRTTFFEKWKAEQFLGQYIDLISNFETNLKKPLKEIEILRVVDKETLKNFNPPSSFYFKEKTVIDLFEEQVLKTPNNVALIYEDVSLTYYELNQKSNQLAQFIRLNYKIERENLIGVILEKTDWLVISILAVLKAGAAYVPIDTQYPKNRINLMLEGNHLRLLISDIKHEELSSHQGIDTIFIDKSKNDIASCNKDNLGKINKEDDTIYVIFTSGSTGKPKGVLVKHHSFTNLVTWYNKALETIEEDCFLLIAPISFDLAQKNLFAPLTVGASLYLSQRIQGDYEKIASTISEKGISIINSAPSAFYPLLSTDCNDSFKMLTSLKKVILGGEPINMKYLLEWGKSDYCNASLMNSYGPTECTDVASYYILHCQDLNAIDHIPIGKPVENTFLYVIDKQQKLCPIGVEGDIYIGGDCVSKGYLNDNLLTDTKFTSNFIDDGFIYNTGDTGKWRPDGNMEYIGRTDNQVKIRGFRVELGEIEAALKNNPGIKDAVVVAKQDKDNNEILLIAYYIQEQIANENELREYMVGLLPRHMIPSHLIQIDAFPLTPSGKVDKKSLPNPDNYNSPFKQKFIPPTNPTEERLIRIWAEILHKEIIGIEDNFFELGGHSLRASQLVSKIYKTFQVKIHLQDIFNSPTIKKLAAIISKTDKILYEAIEEETEKPYYDLSNAQKRIWVLCKLQPESTAYNISAVYSLEGAIDVVLLKEAFSQISKRHSILRTIFLEVEGELKQKIIPAEEYYPDIKILDYLSESLALEKALLLAEQLSSVPFNLENGPLFEVRLLKISDYKLILIFSMHHIISDGWSLQIYFKEVLLKYISFQSNQLEKFISRQTQYIDYVQWQKTIYPKQKKFWDDVLMNNKIPELDFPLDFVRAPIVSSNGSRLKLILSSEISSKINSFAVKSGSTVSNVLFSIYHILLSKWCNQEEVITGVLVSGRNHPDLENALGVFMNFLPVISKPEGYLEFLEYLNSFHQNIIKLYDHQDYPFDLMVNDYLKDNRTLKNPLFQTLFNYHSETDVATETINELLKDLNIKISPHELSNNQSTLDLKVDVWNNGEIIKVMFEYNDRLFNSESIQHLLEKYEDLISLVMQEPMISIESIKLFSEEEYSILAKKQKNNTSLISTEETTIVNICSSFTADPVIDFISYWAKEVSLQLDVQNTYYNQVFQQLLNQTSMLYRKGCINIILLRFEDWIRDSDADTESKIAILQSNYEYLIEIINQLKITGQKYFWGIFPTSSSPYISDELTEQIKELNNRFKFFLQHRPHHLCIDFEGLSALYSVENVFDYHTDKLAHIPFSEEYFASMGIFIIRKIHGHFSKPYKVIVVDCDNTLWKGVCGEDGLDGISIEEGHVYFHNFLLNKANEGFLLAIASKNNEKDVWEIMEKHPSILLKKDHFITARINWKPKSENIQTIAQELNLGTDSFIFLDDSLYEIEEVNNVHPAVLALEIPDNSEELASFLNHVWQFDREYISKEDFLRNSLYQIEKVRNEERNGFSNLDDFIESLKIRVVISSLNAENIERASQLMYRVNQFNLNGIIRSKDEILKVDVKDSTLVWVVDVTDRFGDYGTVGFIKASISHNKLIIDSFLLSCRVLGRKVEDFLFNEILHYAKKKGIMSVSFNYQPTAKNDLFKEFMSRYGLLEEENHELFLN